MKGFYQIGLIAIFLLAFGPGCKKENCFSPPYPFHFRLEDAQAKDMLDPVVSPNLRLTYLDAKTSKEVEVAFELKEQIDGLNDIKKYYLESIEVPWKSLEGNTEFKISSDGIDVHTLSVYVKSKMSNNCTYHEYEKVQFDGADITNTINESTHAYVGVNH